MSSSFFKKICLAASLVLFAACSNDSGSSASEDEVAEVLSTENDSRHDGFILVHSKNVKGHVGTDDLSAKINERPQMETTFSYDFSLEKHETTCGDFKKVMVEEFGDKFFATECDNDSLPVTNVTYYDAILYANARSKAKRLDTAYTYQGKSFNSDNHCVNLEGLNFLPEKEGFRLPLEAEWMLSANQGWNTQNSWNADNSKGQVHKICQSGQNSAGFCDFEGNVMEWVNDWLGLFKNGSISNYVGAPGGNNLGEHILKGGHFNSTPGTIHTYNRGDTYVVTGATFANYVGFRLAVGAIPNPTWLSNNGNASKSKLTALANSATLRKQTGTYNTKIAFRNETTENLTFLDYSSGAMSFVEIEDSIPVYHPEISPNGKHVAFCTKIEGVPGASELYVRDLNEKGSNRVKLDVESAAIPRWKVIDGDTVLIYVSSAKTNSDENFFTESSTWKVSFSNGKFGTPQKILDGAFHGGISDDQKLAVTGSTLLRTRIATEKDIYQKSAKDTVWYNQEQACNVSLAKDGSKRTLFLDFGSSTGKNFVGESYRVHERLFIADSNGKLIQSIMAPRGYSFDHSEWATDNLAIATLNDAQGNHKKIVLVNLADNSLTDLVEGTDLWHPTLWASRSSSAADKTIDLDSAGVYMDPNDSWGSILMRYNMELLWRYHDTLNVAIVGSSRPLESLSPALLSGEFFAINFAHTPNSIYSSKDYLDHYIFPHSPRLKYIVISLDIDFWYKTNDASGGNFFLTNTAHYPGYRYDANHDYWIDGIPDGLLSATENGLRVDNDYIFLGDRGRLLQTACISWGKDALIEMDSTIYDNHSSYINNSIDALKDIIQKAASRDIYVVGMIFPQSPKYKQTGAFGRYGLRRSKAQKVIQQISDLSAAFPNFVLMDENKMGNHDYTDAMALDYDHLCDEGGKQITARLDSLLKTLK